MNERIERIDELLSILFNNMEYEDYIKFIKSNEVLKSYDDVLGKTDIHYYPEAFRKMLNDDVFDEVEKIVKTKMKELNLSED